MVELQQNLDLFEQNGIKVFAISPDSQKVLRKFGEKYRITYPLLSDEDSHVIRKFGILNTSIPENRPTFGIPHPGMYMVGNDGLVFDKSFAASYAVRESVNDVLQESFHITPAELGEPQTITTPYLRATAQFSSPTIRRAQLTILTVEIELANGMHIYGRPLPEGYIPVELAIKDESDVTLERVNYPKAESMELPVLGETLPVYADKLQIKAHCRGINKDQDKPLKVAVQLSYQACDDRMCYLPQTVTFTLPVQFLPHDWDRIR